MEHHTFGEEITDDGTVIRFFSDKWGDDEWDYCVDMGAIYAQMQEDEHLNIPLFDPNRIDSRKVRKELKDKFVNLGHRVNRIPSTVRRI